MPDAVAPQSGVPRCTVAAIVKNRNKVVGAVEGPASRLPVGSETNSSSSRACVREGPLVTWIDDQTQKFISLGSTIKAELCLPR